jgi:hypothetical protein
MGDWNWIVPASTLVHKTGHCVGVDFLAQLVDELGLHAERPEQAQIRISAMYVLHGEDTTVYGGFDFYNLMGFKQRKILFL